MTTTNGGTLEVGPAMNTAASASLALDVGAEAGALVIYPAERFRGREIEISRQHGHGHRVHTGVHQRTTQAGSVLTGGLRQPPGRRTSWWESDTQPASTVAVRAGVVTEMRLS